jgi:hypothetical protein
MDANTAEAAGDRVADELREAGVTVRQFVFPARSGLIAGERQVREVR